MDLRLSEEQVLIRDNIRSYAREVLAGQADENEKTGRFPSEALEYVAELGLCGMTIPEEWGGAGLEMVSYALVIEEIARADASLAVTLSVTNSVCALPVHRFGSGALRERFLRPLATGEMIGGFCLTEPGAGSDASNLATRAERRGDRYVLNGEKIWVTNAEVGKVFVVMAVTDPEAGKKGLSAFLVPADTPGFSFGKLEDKTGLRASKTGSVILSDCEVPADHRLGEEGWGLRIPLASLEAGRIGIAAQSVGIAQTALEEALAYAQERVAFGRPIGALGATQEKIADRATELEAARLMTWRAAWLYDREDSESQKASSMAKLYASETAQRVTYDAVQIFGGLGYSREYRVERLFRDARVTTIYEGTSEIQRLVIARRLMGR
jgi:alkylation response protein AidB-like acyl-CoA dehydrogenase